MGANMDGMHELSTGVDSGTATGAVGPQGPGPGKQTLVDQMQAQGGAAGGNAGRATLYVGSSGPDVAALQQQLTAAGHACEPDGKFGSQTRAAVVAFQRERGLAADGIVGTMTWQALGGGGGGTGAGAGAGAGTGNQPATTENTNANPTPTNTNTNANANTPTTTNTTTNTNTTGDGGGGGGGVEPTAQPTTGNGVRDAIVAAARSKIGTVFSDVAGAADETGDKTRMGWETLTEIFSVGFPSFPKQIIKYIKHGKNNGKPGSNPNGLVSWCGVFATWAVITGGGNCGPWDSGPRCSSMSKITNDPKPGDVGYFTANQHHCIIASVNGNQIETIDGNSYDTDGGGNGAITSKMRSRGEFAGFFRQVDD